MSAELAPPLVLEPSPAPPAGALSVLGKPNPDAWNRHVGELLKIRSRAAADDHAAARRATVGALLSTTGYLASEGHVRELVETLGQDGAELELERLAHHAAELDLATFRLRRRLDEEEALEGLKATSATGEALISTAQRSAKSCQVRTVVTKCGCGARAIEGGCGRADCVRCAPQVTTRRARPVVTKLEGGIDAEIQRLKAQTGRLFPRSRFAVHVAVLTMPEDRRELLASKAAHNRFRRNIVAVFRRNLDAAFAMCATHPVGDLDPSRFHPHFNVLWMRRGLVPWMLPPARLDELKRCWSYLLEHDGHLPVQSRAWRKADARARREGRRPLAYVFPAGPPLALDVHGQWVKGDDARRLRHRARYYARVFVGWRFWLPKAVQWFGDYPRGLVPLVVCPCCLTRFSIIGFGAEAAAKFQKAIETQSARGQAPPPAGPWQRSLPLEGSRPSATSIVAPARA